MITEKHWVTREPMCEHGAECVCQWVITLRGYGWWAEKTDQPEAVSFVSETVPCSTMKKVEEYSPEEIEKFSEAMRKIRNWDKYLEDELYRQLTPIAAVKNWSNTELKVVDGPVDSNFVPADYVEEAIAADESTEPVDQPVDEPIA